MPRATLSIDVPEGTWIDAVTTSYPTALVRVVAVLAGPDRGTALAELRTADPVPLLAAIDRHADIDALELLRQQDDRALVQLETSSPLLLEPAARAGVPLETPIDIRDGSVELSLTTSSRRLSALADRLEEAGLRYETVAVHHDPEDEGGRLSDRQREMLLAAIEAGYYEIPRDATLTEVAASMGIAKATGSDLLRRAERRIVDWYLEEHPARLTAAGGT